MAIFKNWRRAMTIALAIFLCLFAAVIVQLIVQSTGSQSGSAAGLVDGSLTKCPAKDNCVCSEFKEDSKHYVNPIKLSQTELHDALPRLITVIQNMGGTIQMEKETYVAATFSSALFKFVDDLEVRLDSERLIIHLRSASRVGTSDLGANKKRVTQLKALYAMTNKAN